MTDRIADHDAALPLRAWIEPEISTLAIEDTAVFPNRGPDGNARHADCTRS